jgi:ribosomal protein S18 acetylase RimI-like enzyme
MDAGLVIERVVEADDEAVGAFARLVPQLSSAEPPDTTRLGSILAQPGTVVLFARGSDRVIEGTLTLVIVTMPTGRRALIEDVVVDAPFRGRGVASALVRQALEIADTAGCQAVDLTSRPSRVEANALYARLGFARRETNVYRYSLTH